MMKHPLREKLLGFMASLPVPAENDGDVIVRPDGVQEFAKNWLLRGDRWEDGVFASLSDVEDVIEFGLLAREGGAPRNLLHATLVLEAEEALLHVISQERSEMNYERRVSADACAPLDNALRYFAELVRTTH